MKRALIIIALATTAFVPALAVATPAAAAPAEQCGSSGTPQFDMAGSYRSDEHALAVRILPCDAIGVAWSNSSGTHSATYDTGLHASDGILAKLISGSGLDGQPYLSVKAAEPGYVQVWTINASFKVVNIYRLRKTS